MRALNNVGQEEIQWWKEKSGLALARHKFVQRTFSACNTAFSESWVTMFSYPKIRHRKVCSAGDHGAVMYRTVRERCRTSDGGQAVVSGLADSATASSSLGSVWWPGYHPGYGEVMPAPLLVSTRLPGLLLA